MRGNAGAGPLKALDEKSLAEGGQRWRFIPLRDRLNNTSARPSALPTVDFDADLVDIHPEDTGFSHFASALESNAEINITATFMEYVGHVKPLSTSLPLIYRNRKRILSATLEALQLSTRKAAEATPVIANCLTALAKDLGPVEFHPFLGDVVKNFAQVFEESWETRGGRGNGARSAPAYTVFWDPETSMIPLFAALAEITKDSLRHMAADAKGTLCALLPLVGNSHYRVREMTAESCLGYLLRKTRDVDAVRALANAVLEVSVTEEYNAVLDSDGIDGLGVALFEAIRLPAGGLHSRAKDVLGVMLERLRCACRETKSSEATGKSEERFLSIVSRCFAQLSRHITKQQDAQIIAGVLHDELRRAVEDAVAAQVANVCFLTRKWLQANGSKATRLLPRAFQQRFLNLLPTCAKNFLSVPRVIYESLELAGQVSYNSDPALRLADLRAFVELLSVVEKSDNIEVLSCAIAFVMKSRSNYCDGLDKISADRAFASLCNQVAALSKERLPGAPVETPRISLRALRYFGLYVASGSRALCLNESGEIDIPRLGEQVSSLLSEIGDESLEHLRQGQVLDRCLLFLTRMNIPNVQPIFQSLLREKFLHLEDCPAALKAFAKQHEVRNTAVPPNLLSSATRVANVLLCSESTYSSPSALSALCDFAGLLSSETRYSSGAGGSDIFATFLRKLVSTLSHKRAAVRVNGAAALKSAYASIRKSCNVSQVDMTDREGLIDSDMSLQAKLDVLRNSFSNSESPLLGLFQTFYTVHRHGATLERIDSTLRLLQELPKLLQQSNQPDGLAVSATIHFSIGLLRTPLKLLWNSAAELWCAAAIHEQNEAMSVLMDQLLLAEEELAAQKKLVDMSSLDRQDLDEAAVRDDSSSIPERTEKGLRSTDKKRRTIDEVGKSQSWAGISPKRQRSRGGSSGVKTWNPEEWAQHLNKLIKGSYVQTVDEFEDRPANACAFVQELLRTMSKEPRYTIPFRARIIQSYLRVNPTSFSRRKGDELATEYASLLEKMGGLKCCETDNALEEAMRARLIADLTRPGPRLQAASLRCLCASRSQALKPHRDSFLRLIEEGSFREELTILTDKLFSADEQDPRIAAAGPAKAFVVEVLVRVCFSKMIGKRSKIDARRHAVLSFVASKLPPGAALPRITALVLEPIADIISAVEAMEFVTDEPHADGKMPAFNVQRGILSSIESVLRQCQHLLPVESWRRLAFGSFVILRNAGTGANGQACRSQALRILARMCRTRPAEMCSLILPVVKTMKKAGLETHNSNADEGLPAFLIFVAAIYETELASIQLAILLGEAWAICYCLSFMEADVPDIAGVKLALTVAAKLVYLADENSSYSGRTSGSEKGKSVNVFISSSVVPPIRALLGYVTGSAMREGKEEKLWSPIFESCLHLSERLVQTTEMSCETRLTLAEGLVLHLQQASSFCVGSSACLKTLVAVAKKVCEDQPNECEEHTSHVHVFHSLTVKLLPLYGHRKFILCDDAYAELCELLSNVGDPHLAAIVPLLKGMNAHVSSKLDTSDVDRTVDSLNAVIRIFKDTSTASETQLASGLLCHDATVEACSVSQVVQSSCHAITTLSHCCVAAVRSDDSAVRGTASYALQVVGKWLAVSDSKAAVNALPPFLELALSSLTIARTEVLRREYSRAVGEVARNIGKIHKITYEGSEELTGIAILPALRTLAKSEDADVDFYENLVHLQAHRRGRALRRLSKEVLSLGAEEGPVDGERNRRGVLFATKFALPIGFNMALESTVGEKPKFQRHSRHAESRDSAQKDVSVWAVALVGVSVSWLYWPDYKSFLLGLLRRLKSCTDAEIGQTLDKLLVTSAEAFSEVVRRRSVSVDLYRHFLIDTLLPKMLAHISAGAVEGKILDTGSLITRTNPREKHEKCASTVFRGPVAIAVAHLVKQLPLADAEALMPRLVTPLTGALRSRMSATRDGSKKALTSVSLVLGTKYLRYILDQILSALCEGYRKDACVYVIHALLEGIRAKKESSAVGAELSVDGSASLIVSYLAQELEDGSHVASNDFENPNESSSRQKQSSARFSRAVECAGLLAQLIDFKSSASVLLMPFEALLAKTSSAKLMTKTDTLMHNVLVGFSKNASMELEDALKLCYYWATSPQHSDAAAASRISTDLLAQAETGAKACEVPIRDTAFNGHRMISFSLQLLSILVTKKLPERDVSSLSCPKTISMLEPFLFIVGQALSTSYDSLTLDALKASQKLLKLPLSNKNSIAEQMSAIIVDVLSKKGGALGATDALFNASLRAAAVLLKEVGSKEFTLVSRDRVEALISISCDCIESGGLDARSAALALLRSAVTTETMIPAVYDAMEKVNAMAVRAQSSSLRASCTSLSIAFMVSFPLGSRRVRQHLEFFVRNLNYELPNGRLAALEALRTITRKFPAEVLELECEYLLIALAASAARDVDPNCRSQACKALQLLFERVPTNRNVVDLLKMSASLAGVDYSMNGMAEDIKMTAWADPEVALSGFAALTAASKSQRLSFQQLGAVVRVLVSAAGIVKSSDNWESLYICLQGIEASLGAQVLNDFPQKLELHSSISEFWIDIPSLLLHRHQWVRLSAARLLEKHLFASGGRHASLKPNTEERLSVLWAGDGIVREILKACCLQLEAEQLTEELGQQCLKNLLCLGHIVYRNQGIADLANSDKWSASDVTVKEAENGIGHTIADANRGLLWLLSRISGLAMRAGHESNDMLRRGCALRFLLVTAKWWGATLVRSYEQAYIAPVVKVLESGTPVSAQNGHNSSAHRSFSDIPARSDGGDVVGDRDVRTLASTLQDVLIELLEAPCYYKTYQEMRSKRTEVKETRKRQAALELAVNPERAAKRRRKKAEARKMKKGRRSFSSVGAAHELDDSHIRAKSRLTADL